jgi:hypothetical protein
VEEQQKAEQAHLLVREASVQEISQQAKLTGL